MNKHLFAVSGIFNTPNEIMKAAKATAANYKKFDVNTPYPVHGMDSAMKLGRSKLGYIALALGLTGTLTAVLLAFFTMYVDYPMNIGGKIAFPLPAFVPIMFELTVLLATVGTVTGMIAIFFKFPNNSHPLHDTEYMKMVSSDKFGVVIEATDKNFDLEKAQKFLEDLGADFVKPIYYDENEVASKPKTLTFGFATIMVLLIIVTSGTTYFALNKLTYMNPFTWMMEQDKISAQEKVDFFEDGFSMRVPVSGTVARGFKPYPYKGEPELAGQFMVNPLEATEENLKVGEEKWNTFCSPCHGYYGEGDSRLRGQFPNPPSIHTDKVRDEWSDGRLYAVIMDGQNSMPSYAAQMTEAERWKVILYVRALQRALNAKDGDLQ